jgi:hypothetical protein
MQQVVVGPGWREAAAQMVAAAPQLSVDEVVDSPFVLYAQDADRGAAELAVRHERYGFDSYTTHQPSMEALGEVIAAYRRGSH